MIRHNETMREETRDKMRGGHGPVKITHLLEPEDFKSHVRLCSKLTLPPGSSIGLHEHEKEDEIYLITHGTGLLEEAGKKSRVNQGDAVVTGNGASHMITNDGPADLEIMAIIICYT